MGHGFFKEKSITMSGINETGETISCGSLVNIVKRTFLERIFSWHWLEKNKIVKSENQNS